MPLRLFKQKKWPQLFKQLRPEYLLYSLCVSFIFSLNFCLKLTK